MDAHSIFSYTDFKEAPPPWKLERLLTGISLCNSLALLSPFARNLTPWGVGNFGKTIKKNTACHWSVIRVDITWAWPLIGSVHWTAWWERLASGALGWAKKEKKSVLVSYFLWDPPPPPPPPHPISLSRMAAASFVCLRFLFVMIERDFCNYYLRWQWL